MPHPVHPIQQVLLIENHASHADVICTELSELPEVCVTLMANVVNAIRFLAKRDGFRQAPTPDLVLLDLDLPYFSGMALLHERRRRPAWSSIPIVVLSEHEHDRQTCLAHGADNHLLKPHDRPAWRPLIRHILAQHLPAWTRS